MLSRMGFHHVAVAARDLAATHRFYTEAMGFELVKMSAVTTDHPDGWAKHAFYDTGGNGLDRVLGSARPTRARGLRGRACPRRWACRSS